MVLLYCYPRSYSEAPLDETLRYPTITLNPVYRRPSGDLVLILLSTSRGRRKQSNAAKVSSNGGRTAEIGRRRRYMHALCETRSLKAWGVSNWTTRRLAEARAYRRPSGTLARRSPASAFRNCPRRGDSWCPRNGHVAATASPRPVSADYPRRGVAASRLRGLYPRRGVAASRLRGRSASRPRRPVSADYPRGIHGVAATRLRGLSARTTRRRSNAPKIIQDKSGVSPPRRYAFSRGLAPPAVSSVQDSLAAPRHAPWPGTEVMTDEDRTWYAAHPDVPVVCWEVLAKGFLAGKWDRADAPDPTSRPSDVAPPAGAAAPADMARWREARLTSASVAQRGETSKNPVARPRDPRPPPARPRDASF